jgi:hypothetical protein
LKPVAYAEPLQGLSGRHVEKASPCWGFLAKFQHKGGEDKSKVKKVKLSLCLTKHHAMKTYFLLN